MFKPIHIADKRKALAFANNLVALLGLLVLGFPVTLTTIKTTVISWALLTAATMQVVVRYLTLMQFQETRRENN